MTLSVASLGYLDAFGIFIILRMLIVLLLCFVFFKLRV